MKRNPTWVGRRKTGLDVKRREKLLESPNADAVIGPTTRSAKNAEGVASALMGCSAVLVNDAV